MIKVLLVGTGGFFGSILRYLISGLVQTSIPGSTFPYGTLVVNATGCYIIGLVAQLIEAQGALGDSVRAFLVLGVLGGYTTFSTFGNETISLLQDGQSLTAATNVVGQVALALGAVWLGRFSVQLIWR